MGMHAGLGFRFKCIVECFETFLDAVNQECTCRICHVDAVCAVRFHQLGLLGEFFGRAHVCHHQKSRDVHAKLTSVFDVLLGDVGFSAVGCNSHAASARGIGFFQVLDGTYAGDQ